MVAMGFVRSEHARKSIERIFAWGQEAGIEVVEVAASLGGAAGELRASRTSDRTPDGRVGAGIGWTVALPSRRNYGSEPIYYGVASGNCWKRPIGYSLAVSDMLINGRAARGKGQCPARASTRAGRRG
jgi:hypothetical protein